jgi:hypothetical protein
MNDFETDAGERDENCQQKVPTKDRGYLQGREITNEDERQFLLKQLADARREKK